jgi:hypothetical protein
MNLFNIRISKQNALLFLIITILTSCAELRENIVISQSRMEEIAKESNSTILLKIPDYNNENCSLSFRINGVYYYGMPGLLSWIKPGTEKIIVVPEGNHLIEYEIHMYGGGIKHESEKESALSVDIKKNQQIVLSFKKEGEKKETLSFCLVFPFAWVVTHQKIIMIQEEILSK